MEGMQLQLQPHKPDAVLEKVKWRDFPENPFLTASKWRLRERPLERLTQPFQSWKVSWVTKSSCRYTFAHSCCVFFMISSLNCKMECS